MTHPAAEAMTGFGPWFAGDSEVTDMNEDVVAEVYGGNVPSIKARTNLIAAAPDLLEALERFYYDTLYRDCPEAHDLAKAALEKARG